MPDELAPLEEVAARFEVDAPPPGSSWETRGSYLHARLDEARSVAEAILEAMPEIEADAAAVDATTDTYAPMAARVLEAITSGATSLPGADALSLARKTIGACVIAGYKVAASSSSLYAEPAERAARFLELGKIGVAEVDEDYRQRLGIAEAITRLASSGALDAILDVPDDKPAEAPQAFVVVAVVAGLVALAFVIVHFYEVRERSERWRLSCLDDAGKVRPEYRDLCLELLKDEKAAGGFLSQLLSAAPWVAGAALLLWFFKR